MPDAGLDSTQRVESVCEVPLGAGGLQLLVPSMAVGVLIEHHCVADGVQATHSVISATRELCSGDERVDFCPWIVEVMELPL